MPRLGQRSIEEIARRALPDDPRDPEYFYPTDAHRAAGNWAVVFESLDESGEPMPGSTVHIVPIFGTQIHKLRGDCLCEPAYDSARDLWTHYASQ